MLRFYLLTILFHSKLQAQLTQSPVNLPPISLEDNNLDDRITQIFNHCKCVIFYLCDEENFIIPQEDIKTTKVPVNYPLRQVKRLRCSNEFYYCCRDRTSGANNKTFRNAVNAPSAAAPKPTVRPIRPSEQSRQNCGQSSFSGNVITEFPWTTAVYRKQTYPQNGYAFKCGGSLIHPKIVLTAHHCLLSASADSIKVKLQSEEINLDWNSAITRSVAKIIKYDSYYSGGSRNNIALLILGEPVVNISPVCLPTSSQSFNDIICVATGWGNMNQTSPKSGDRIRKVSLPLVGSQRCENLLRTALRSTFVLHSSVLCAGGVECEDTCKGDGGGPLMCVENGRYIQVGIVSWGLECGRRDVPGLYTNVARFRSWIDSEARKENLLISDYSV